MNGLFCQKARTACLTAWVLFLAAVHIHAQDAPKSAQTNQTSIEPAGVQALTESILELKSQLQSMSTQLAELRQEQARAHEEARALRRQLDLAQGKSSAPEGALPSYSSSTALSAATPTLSANTSPPSGPKGEQENSDRVSNLEENQQLLDAKISEQYQTKVESESKYRLKLSGIVLLNVFANRGTVDNLDFPQLAFSSLANAPDATFGGSLRQSQIGFQAFGPDIAGARTSADLRFDFAGGFPATPSGVSTGLVRLRTGTIRMDWGHTALVAGQDHLFFAPLTPTSLASLATPALSYSGNLWSWTPQVRLEHSLDLSEGTSLDFQAGILDSLSGEPPKTEYNRAATNGEGSGQPAYAARIAWRQRTFGQRWTLGLGGYYSRQNWGFGRNVDSWTGTTDLSLPLGKFFGFSGEFYRGRAVAGLGGGIGQSVLLSSAVADPATLIKGLDSMGGWGQLKFKPKPKLEINGAFGQDNPYASELRLFPASANYSDEPLARNRTALVNLIYQLRSDVLFSIEYRRMRTQEVGGDSYIANHVNLGFGYVF
jgi:hypothetical protein